MNHPTAHETAAKTATEWLVKLQSPQLTEAQKQDFFTWLDQKPEHQRAYIEAEALWKSLAPMEQLAAESASARITPVARPWYRRPQTIAASFFGLALLVAIQLWPGWEGNQYQTAIGEQSHVALADGSNIDLNTNSTLQVELRKNRRLLKLSQGEAFFQVSHDPDRPFVVETPSGLVRVLGTRFNVYADALETTVTVVEGKVGVTETTALAQMAASDYQPRTTLTANQQITLDGDGVEETPVQVDAAVTTTWRQGKQIYNSVPFVDVVRDLNRYFTGEVKLGDPALENIQVVAVLDLRDKARAIAALESTFHLVAVQESDELTLLMPQPAGDQRRDTTTAKAK